MKKLIEFYPCPKCGKNLFELEEIFDEELHLSDNLMFENLTNNSYDLKCFKCDYILFRNHNANEKSYFAFLVEIINQFIKENEKKIDKKIKNIWKKYLNQTIKKGLKNITF